MTAAGIDGSGHAASRTDVVTAAAERWRDELAALGGRDPLLSFRDLKVGTLDLAAADPEARKRLLDGEAVLISRLFPHEPLRSSALRTTRAIRDKARELAEERGLSACLLAVGVATWANPFAAHRPTAPVLLRTASVVARDPAETDFRIEVADDPFVNPVLLHALDTQLGLRFSPDDLRDAAGRLRYASVVEQLREFAPPHVVDGFSIAHRAVLATFATEPLRLVRDLAAFDGELQEHDVIAAVAGDADARASLSRPVDPEPPAHPAFDLDADQEAVVAAVAAGAHLRVDAPPGSGGTQAVAAAVAESIARGRRVLVVGQKRATLDDLHARLSAADLQDLVLDLGRTPPAEAVHEATEAVRRLVAGGPSRPDHQSGPEPASAPPPAGPATAAETALDAYRDALHRRRDPAGNTAYDALVSTATTSPKARTDARIAPDHVRTGDLAASSADLREFTELEGLSLTEEGSPWWGSDVPTREAAEELLAVATSLRANVGPRLRDAATRAAVEVGLAGPATLAECLDIVDLLASVAETNRIFGPAIWDEPLDELAVATGDRAYRAAHPTPVGLLARRRLRARVRDLVIDSGHHGHVDEHHQLLAAVDDLHAWQARSRDGRTPRTGPHLPDAIDAAAVARRRLTVLNAANPRTGDLADLDYPEVGRRLAELVADDAHLRAMPRLSDLQARLSAAGLDDVLADLRRRRLSPDRAGAVLEFAWQSSLLDDWRSSDEALRGFDLTRHEQARTDLRGTAQARRSAAATAVRSAHAALVRDMADEFEGQTVVITESPEGTGPRTPRELVEVAPDVVLAAKPCWIMSPLTVAAALPAQQLFDTVIVVDAGRLAVAQAVPALARARQVVLIGDDEIALTAFTTAVEPAPDPDEHEGPWGEDPPPSPVDLLRDVLPVRALTGQYRVRDDRLVGFAARTTYAGRLSTVPGVGGSDRLSIQLVEAPAGEDDPVDSSSAEVARVVELVLDHLRTRPHESLGVVTLGPRHAERLDSALRRALVRHPDVAGHVHEDRAEPFFVKDVERVAGDVRDAIILSLGYGRSVDGRILYRFGALGRPGGERRLAAATTRARERMVVVSTFGSDDLSPRRLTTPGAQALGDFLAYVERPAGPATDSIAVEDTPEDSPGNDALARAVADRLRRAGATVVVGHGGPSGVALAVRHPTRRDRFVLAVETDGPAFGARRSALVREHLRPLQLERLGWSVHQVWSAAWAADPERETARVIAAYEKAVADADAYDWAVAAAEADVVAGMPDDVPEAQADRSEQPGGGDAEAGEGSGRQETAGGDPAGPAGTGDRGTEAAGPETGGPGTGDGAGQRKSVRRSATPGKPVGTVADDHDGDAGVDGDPAVEHARVRARPAVPAGRPVSEYTGRELAAMARWIESDGVPRTTATAAAVLAEDLGLGIDDDRSRDVLQHAIRVARAGAPGV